MSTKIANDAYSWERKCWPQWQRVLVTAGNAARLLREFTQRFHTPTLLMRITKRSQVSSQGGHYRDMFYSRSVYYSTDDEAYHPQCLVQLYGRYLYVGTIVHEFAHHMNAAQCGFENSEDSHGESFRNCLCAVYSRLGTIWQDEWQANIVRI